MRCSKSTVALLSMFALVLVAIGLTVAIFAFNTPADVTPWLYDWVEIYDGARIVELPAPHGDSLRQRILEVKSQALRDWHGGNPQRASPQFHFRMEGNSVVKVKIFSQLQKIEIGSATYRLDKDHLAKIEREMTAACANEAALRLATELGVSRQRVRAACALLENGKQRNLAAHVLSNEISSDSKDAAEEAIRCCGKFKIFNRKVEAGFHAALGDGRLKWVAYSEIDTIGPKAKGLSNALKRKLAETRNEIERSFIESALKSIEQPIR